MSPAFEIMLEHREENVFNLLRPFFPGGIPRDIAGALEAVILFYSGGAKPEEKEKGSTKRVYSFDIDAETIFSDFWQFYKIDLSTERLHWFVFRSLLFGLSEESGFKKRIYYRTCNLKNLPKKERERIMKIRKQIEIVDKVTGGKMTLEERNAKMKAYVRKRSKEVQEVKDNG